MLKHQEFTIQVIVIVIIWNKYEQCCKGESLQAMYHKCWISFWAGLMSHQELKKLEFCNMM